MEKALNDAKAASAEKYDEMKSYVQNAVQAAVPKIQAAQQALKDGAAAMQAKSAEKFAQIKPSFVQAEQKLAAAFQAMKVAVEKVKDKAVAELMCAFNDGKTKVIEAMSATDEAVQKAQVAFPEECEKMKKDAQAAMSQVQDSVTKAETSVVEGMA